MDLNSINFILDLANDIRFYYKYYHKNKNSNKFFTYQSDIVGKTQISLEMLIEFRNKGQKHNFRKKGFVVFLLELLRCGLKFKELKKLSSFGYSFYIESNIYLEQVLELNKEEFMNRLDKLRYV
jgi:hypothetical protein